MKEEDAVLFPKYPGEKFSADCYMLYGHLDHPTNISVSIITKTTARFPTSSIRPT